MGKSSGWNRWKRLYPSFEPNVQSRSREYETKNYRVVEAQEKDLCGRSEKDLSVFQIQSVKTYIRKSKK